MIGNCSQNDGSSESIIVTSSNPIASRPRFAPYTDTENFTTAGFGGTVTRFPFFSDSQFFIQPGSGGEKIPKQYGLDTTQIGPGGGLQRGNYLRVFGLNSYISFRNLTPTAARLDNIRMLYDTGYFRFDLGSTPYMFVPFHRIPSGGSGLTGDPSTTQIATTSGSFNMGIPTPCCYFDVTVPTRVCAQVMVDREIEVMVPDFQSDTPGDPVTGTRMVCIEVPATGAPAAAELEKACAAAYAKGDNQRNVVMRRVKKQISELARKCDIRVPRTPLEFEATENFQANVIYPERPVLTGAAATYFITISLVSTWLKPLAA